MCKNTVKMDCFGCGPGGKTCKVLAEMLCKNGKCSLYKEKNQFEADRERYAKNEDGSLPPTVGHIRRVRCLETGKVYATVTAAAEDLFLSVSMITAVCKGRRKAAGGLTFEYVG